MKKLNIIFLFLLIGCGTNINFKSGLTNFCSDSKDISSINLMRINVPDIVSTSPHPEKSGYKQFDNTEPISPPDINILKDNRFIASYYYVNNGRPNNISSDVAVAKIFNDNEEEIVQRFKIVEKPNLGYYKVITNKNLNYFLVFYEIKNNIQNNNNTQPGFYLKKFDLEGNQLSEIKLKNTEVENISGNVSFSFDKDSNNLILSWVSLQFSHRDEYTCPFLSRCAIPTMVPPIYSHPVINTVKFDNNFNYCLSKYGFNDSISDRISSPKIYITKNRDYVLFPISFDNIKKMNTKDNTVEIINFGNDSQRYNLERISEDENGNFYFIGMDGGNGKEITYKTDKNFKIIESGNILNPKDSEELSVNNERIIELGSKYLLVKDFYFRIVKSLEDNL